MKPIIFKYKLNYGNSFVATLSLFFIAVFIGLWLFFFVNPFYTIALLVGVTLFLLYWNSKTDGKAELTKSQNQNHLKIDHLNLDVGIKNSYFGWNYAFVNHGKALSASPMIMSTQNNQKVDNTYQNIIFLELENGQNLIFIKELMPWQDPGKLPYIGELVNNKTIAHSIYIKRKYHQLKTFLEK